MEEEKQARVGQVSELLGWVKGLQGRAGGPNTESSLAAQQVVPVSFEEKTKKCLFEPSAEPVVLPSKAISEQLAARKDQVSDAIRNTQVFLLSKQASKYVSLPLPRN